jgi:hypothetical protein
MIPSKIAPISDPGADGRSRLLGRAFWVMMAFSALCMVAAMVVGVLGPRLFVARHAPSANAIQVESPGWR